MHRHTAPCTTPVSLAVASLLALLSCASPSALAQDDASLPNVSVAAPKPREARAAIGGFGQQAEWTQPLAAQRFSAEALVAAQVQRLSDVVKLDASISDAYNAVGYWDYLSVRGFVLDNAHNYRREGLPIDAQTSIALDNKAAVEVLKGISGMQAGLSSPGGLVNYIVKRPTERVRSALIQLSDSGDWLTAIDLSERFGQTQQYGLRVNAAHERLDTSIRNTRGLRDLAAVAGDWRLSPGTLLEAELEYSRRKQPSVPGFSMLGNMVPSAVGIDPDTNINSQAWSLPVIMQGTTGTLRLSHEVGEGWKAVGTYGEQHTRADDRTAFPFGAPSCYSLGTWCDRYSDTGAFGLLNYRSDGETRLTRALDIQLAGQLATGSVQHEVTFGALRTLTRIDVPTASSTLTGFGEITGQTATPYAAALDSPQNDRQERSNEFYVRDSLRLSEAWRAWAGLRHTRMARAQTLSDLSLPTSRVSESLTTPWLALGYQFGPMQQAYVSWGEGVEVLPPKFSTSIAPYLNSGEVLPALKSRQWEIGIKGQGQALAWSVGYFRIVRPEASSVDTGTFSGFGLPEKRYQIDGDALHRGVEGQLRARVQACTLDLSAVMLDAERRGSVKPGINGKAPSNVPDYAVKMGHGLRLGLLNGLTLQGDIVHEGPRTVDVVNDVRIPAWTRIDIGMSLAQGVGSGAITWRLGVTNLLDTRAWQESPTQFDHIYLLPMATRKLTASAQIAY